MLGVALLLGLLSTPPHAVEPPEARVSWEEALRLARESPSVLAARNAALQKKGVDAGISGLGNPEVGLTAGVRAGEIDEGFEGQVSVVQPIPLAPVGSERRKAARAETRLLDAQARLVLLERSLEVAASFCELYAAERAVEGRRRGIELADELLAAVERGKEAEIFTSSQVAMARSRVVSARLEHLAAEGEAFDRGIELGRLIHHPGPFPLLTVGPLPRVELPPPAQMEAALDPKRLPPVAAQALEAEAARARLREREVEGRAFWIGVGATALKESQERALLGTLSFSLPVFERNLRERGQLLAEAHLQEGRDAEAKMGATAWVAALLHKVEHSEEVHHLARSLLEIAEEELRLAHLAFEVGEATLLEVLEAQERLVDVHVRAHEAEAARALARVRLGLLIETLGGSVEE